MSITTTDLFPIEQVTFCTATVVTHDGHYVVVIRPGFITFVSGAGPFVGRTFEGDAISIREYGQAKAMRLTKNGGTVLLTSDVKSINIHEN